jgi:hypothetical protein
VVKLVYCLRRLSNLSLEEFQRYWLETHGPLVRKHVQALGIRRCRASPAPRDRRPRESSSRTSDALST